MGEPFTKRPVGYYVHHQGRGHAQRAQVLMRHWRRPVTVFTSRPDYFEAGCAAEVVELPLDYPVDAAHRSTVAPRSSVLHYAPLHVAGLRERMATLAQWIAQQNPIGLIVDVSVEVAMLGRLLGVPTVVTKLQGDRSDEAHRVAFEHAAAILCPYPQALERYPVPESLLPKCIYTGAYSRFAERPPTAAANPNEVLVLIGSGGSQVTASRCAELARSCPDYSFRVLGRVGEVPTGALPQNLSFLGHRADVWPELCRAELVVAGAGTNAVYEVGAAGKPLVCLPEERAFGEQVSKARGLEAAGLAICCEHWPRAVAWPRVLAKARSSEPADAWAAHFTDPDLSTTARHIEAALRSEVQ